MGRCFCTLNPFTTLALRLDALRWNWVLLRRISTPNARSYIRTLSDCKVVVNLSSTAYHDFHKLGDFHENVTVVDLSDALVVGNEVDRKDANVQLNRRGKEMLVTAGALPPVE